MTPEELADVRAEWEKKWEKFCEWIVNVYGPKLEHWTPQPSRH